jgi:CheY-like chemotaxis protein
MNHVVLADDDLDHAYLFKMILSEVDPTKTVTIVKDGAELMEFLSKQIPDLLFLDLSMPCKTGMECLEEIRQKLQLEELPVVVYSNSSHMRDIEKSYVSNADLYMVKPFNANHLRNALSSIFNMEWRKKYTNPWYYFMNNRFVPYTA